MLRIIAGSANGHRRCHESYESRAIPCTAAIQPFSVRASLVFPTPELKKIFERDSKTLPKEIVAGWRASADRTEVAQSEATAAGSNEPSRSCRGGTAASSSVKA